MQLNDFATWKQEALVYWTNQITGSTNAFYTYAITSASASSYAGTPVYSNYSTLLSQVTSALDNTETYYNNYLNSASLSAKFKELLIPLYSYVTMKDTTIIPTAPSMNVVDINALNLFKIRSYELPPYNNLFTLSSLTVTGYDGNPITTNTDLLTYRMWYAGVELVTPEPTATYITAKGSITNNAITAVNTTISTAAATDIASITAKITELQAPSTDYMVFRVFGQPPVIPSTRTAKQFILEDYNYTIVLDDFGWLVRGVNAP